jgi:hypothetical protein
MPKLVPNRFAYPSPPLGRKYWNDKSSSKLNSTVNIVEQAVIKRISYIRTVHVSQHDPVVSVASGLHRVHVLLATSIHQM